MKIKDSLNDEDMFLSENTLKFGNSKRNNEINNYNYVKKTIENKLFINKDKIKESDKDDQLLTFSSRKEHESEFKLLDDIINDRENGKVDRSDSKTQDYVKKELSVKFSGDNTNFNELSIDKIEKDNEKELDDRSPFNDNTKNFNLL